MALIFCELSEGCLLMFLKGIVQNVNADAVWMNTTVGSTIWYSVTIFCTSYTWWYEIWGSHGSEYQDRGARLKFCMVVRDLFGFTAWLLLLVALLVPRILRWLLRCWKMHGLLYRVVLVWAVTLLFGRWGWQLHIKLAWVKCSVTSQKNLSAKHEVVLNNTTVLLNVSLTVHDSTLVQWN
jgi:hypothetical protein